MKHANTLKCLFLAIVIVSLIYYQSQTQFSIEGYVDANNTGSCPGGSKTKCQQQCHKHAPNNKYICQTSDGSCKQVDQGGQSLADCQKSCKASGGQHHGPSTVSSVITQQMWTKIFPNQSNPLCKTGASNTADILSWSNFIKACNKFPQFGKKPIEIAAFLANMTQETWGGDAIGGGCFGAELGCWTGDNSSNCPYYVDSECPTNTSAGYYGRGPLQLSYCANYKAAGDAIGRDLLNDPNILMKDGAAAFEASLWYWTTYNQGSCCGGAVQGKTCHDVINEPNPDFTKTIAIINGGVECGKGADSGLDTTEFLRRTHTFKRICGILGIPVPPCGSTCNSWAAGQVCYQ